MSDTPRQNGRLIPFPVIDVRTPPEAAALMDDEADAAADFGPAAIGLPELRAVVASFIGLLDSFELYVRQVHSLAALALSNEPLDRPALHSIVENSERDAARVAEIRVNYERLQAILDEAIDGRER